MITLVKRTTTLQMRSHDIGFFFGHSIWYMHTFNKAHPVWRGCRITLDEAKRLDEIFPGMKVLVVVKPT